MEQQQKLLSILMEKLVEMREDQADIRIAMGQRDQSIHEKIAQIQGHVESNVGILQDEVMAMDNQFKRIGKGKLPSQKFQKRESVSKKLSNSHIRSLLRLGRFGHLETPK